MQSAALDSSLTEGEELKGTRRIAAHVTQDVSLQKPMHLDTHAL